MGTRDLPDMYALSPWAWLWAYISGKSLVPMLQLSHKATQILFNNNNIQPSNIKLIGNMRHGFWHMTLTTQFSILLFILFILLLLLLFSCFAQLVQI